MAAHSFIHLGEQWFFACRESYIPEFAAIFRDDERVSDLEAPIYALEASKLRERLRVLGFTPSTARRVLGRAYEEARQYDEDLEPIEAFLEQAGQALADADALSEDVPMWTWSADPRLLLRLLVDLAPDDAQVAFDISDVVSRGHADGRPDLCARAFAELHGEAVFSPLIVLTEGTTDAEVLALTIEVLVPHLRGYVRFLDYDFKPEGSTSALVRAIRSFAAAGVSNRVVALFDSDAAASEALTTLDISMLPRNFRVRQLPPLPLASEYPTLGPSGLSDMDVNGLAVSVEMFFGEDILRLNGSELIPVQWRGYMGKVKRYQGELMEKGALQAAFRKRARAALQRGYTLPSEDWSGMALLVSEITSSFE